jgi:hypothetical protein
MSGYDLADTFLQQYLPSLYRSSMLEGGYGRFCNGTSAYFQIDSQSYEFTIDFYGEDAALTLTSPDGPPPPTVIIEIRCRN